MADFEDANTPTWENMVDGHVNLADAIALILDDRREDGLRGVPTDAIREIVTIE